MMFASLCFVIPKLPHLWKVGISDKETDFFLLEISAHLSLDLTVMAFASNLPLKTEALRPLGQILLSLIKNVLT